MDKRLKELIDKSNNIVFFGGAGVSTESDIPDFRSENGIFNAMKIYGHSPEYLVSYDNLYRNPDLFFKYYKENMVYSDALPNDAHKTIAYLEKIGKVKACITQNIDGLHQKAGSKTVYELHGSINKNYCVSCNTKYPLEYMLDEGNCKDSVPHCSKCGDMVRPDVVLYGEPLDNDCWKDAEKACKDADLLIVGGTSLVVYPAALLVKYFKGDNLVLINRDSTQFDSAATLNIKDNIGKVMKIDGEVFI